MRTIPQFAALAAALALMGTTTAFSASTLPMPPGSTALPGKPAFPNTPVAPATRATDRNARIAEAGYNPNLNPGFPGTPGNPGYPGADSYSQDFPVVYATPPAAPATPAPAAPPVDCLPPPSVN